MLEFLLWRQEEVVVCLTQEGSLFLGTELCEGLRDAEGKIPFLLLIHAKFISQQYLTCLANLKFNLK